MNLGVSSINELTEVVIGSAIRIHRAVGPGLLESVYEALLERDLRRAGLGIERQKSVSFDFDGLHFEHGFRVDLLVDGRLVVEVKSAVRHDPVHEKQLLTYLRLLDLRVGLLINFSGATLKTGVRRVVNGLPEADSIVGWRQSR